VDVQQPRNLSKYKGFKVESLTAAPGLKMPAEATAMVRQYFNEVAAKKGLKIVADEAYQKGAADYRSTLTKIKAQNPDLVLMVSYVADAILLMRQSREVGLNPSVPGRRRRSTRPVRRDADLDLVYSVTQWTATQARHRGFESAAKQYERPLPAPRVRGHDGRRRGRAKAGGDREKVAPDRRLDRDHDRGEFEVGGTGQKTRHARHQYQGGRAVTVFPQNPPRSRSTVPRLEVIPDGPLSAPAGAERAPPVSTASTGPDAPWSLARAGCLRAHRGRGRRSTR
jgi:hypothetical protein